MKKTVCLVVLSLLCLGFVSAQEVSPIMLESGQREPNGRSLALTALDIDITICDTVSETKLTMTFFNPAQIDVEGTLYVPLSENGVVSGYALDIDGVLVDGVPVKKRKGREVFEKIVRQGIDPGLAEWTKGNTFKTRVYPIPGGGSRTVQVRYLSDLHRQNGIPMYYLPLNFPEPIRDVSMHVEVVNTDLPPVIRKTGFSELQFRAWRSGFVADTELSNAVLKQGLYISLPPVDLKPVAVERGADGHFYFTCTDVEVPAARSSALTEIKNDPTRIALYWDASDSRSAESLIKSFEFLSAYFESVNADIVSVDCIVFRNEVEDTNTFHVENGNAEALLSFLRNLAYDGGTQMGTLPKADYRCNFAFLFSDGLSNFGSHEPPVTGVPLYVFADDTQVNYPFLKYLALKNGGDFFNLRTQDISAVLSGIRNESFAFLKATVDAGRVSDIYPQLPRPIHDVFRISGKLESPSATIRVHYGRNGKSEVVHTFRILRDTAMEGELLSLVWAQDKLNHLLIFPERNAAVIRDHGKEFGLVTPGTSLIVLDDLEQYIEHKIPPPRMLPKMRREYFTRVAEERRREENRQEQKIGYILEIWQEKVDWWNTEFSYPKDFRFGREEVKMAEEEESYATGAEAPALAPEEVSERQAASDVSGGEVDKKEAKQEDDEGPAVEIRPWDPATPYLEALKAEGPSSYYREYLVQKREYGSSPAFYLDCADFFFARGVEEFGLRILSNLAELELENPALLRVLAHRLEQKNYLSLSKSVFEEVLRMRPEEPQSYRDLALVCGRQMEYKRSVELLYRVVLGKWDRFDRIELVALMEMNNMIRKAVDVGMGPQHFAVDRRLIKMLDVDLRIVLTWDTDLTDMDLWVIEPSGEKCSYSNNRTTIGGHLSKDFTDGYGPEEYMLKKAMDGTYNIQVDYYSSSAPALTGAVTLQIVIFTDYGRPEEKRQAVTVRLRDSDDVIDIGEVEF